MSTNKLLQSLSEDPQLEKQIGCMAGILQLFDRHQVLTGRRLYGHKRIAAAASKMQTPLTTSNCGSPGSDSNGTLIDNAPQNSIEQPRQKQAPASEVVASLEKQRSQPPHMPTTPTEVKSSLAFSSAPLLSAHEAAPIEVNGRNELPKISFDMARSSLLAPRRLDSSRSLHEARVNVAHDTKVFARKSVDTAERAAAAARGALKELSRISSDFTGPSPHEEQVSIRDIVRSSLGQDRQAARASTHVHSPFPPRMAGEANTCASRASLHRDMSRVHNAESKSSSDCHPVQASNTSMPQAGGRLEAPRPPRHNSKPKAETPQKSCADHSESLRLLAKLREASPTYNTLLYNEGAEDANGSKYSIAAHRVSQQARSSQVEPAREVPAFSSRASLPRMASDRIPGRMSSYEPSRASSVDSIIHPKAREGPRLSLDGRVAGSGIKADRDAGSQSKLQPRTLLTSRSVSCSNSDCDTESLHDKRASFSSNVVAKLMGLEEMPNGEANPKLGLSTSSDQKSMRASAIAMQDVNPTFTQCGKYVSASFFPSRRRDDIKIALDSEEEEEESDLHLESLSQQDARTLNVRVGSLKSQGGDRVVIENGNHMGVHPCYQPKNHHLIEDRPPHVLSPAARLCAQIEEMQRADSVYKDFDKDTRTLGLQQSSKPELEALKQLLGAIQLKKEYAKSYVENFPMQGSPRKLQPESEWMPYSHELHPQAEQPSAVTWKTKRVLVDEFDSQIREHNVNNRRNSLETHNRRLVKNGIHERALHPTSRQHMLPENYNQGPRIRADAYISPGSSSSSMCNTPRKATLSLGGTHIVQATPPMKGARRMVAHIVQATPPASPNGLPTKCSTSPRTPVNQQLRSSNNSSCSWDASSISSTSSNNAREHYVSSYSAANKQKKPSERGLEKKKSGILKDKEESKANLVSLKPSTVPPTEKKVKSVAPSANSRTLQQPIQTQNGNLRSSMRTPTRSIARKEVDVKRKLSFSNRSASQLPHLSESCAEDEEAKFVDKTIVMSIIENTESSTSSLELHEAGHHVMDQNKCMSVGSHENDFAFLVNTASINRVRTEGGAKGSLLPLAGANAEKSTLDCEVASPIFERDAGAAISPICTPTGALRLPQVLQQENEDTESQGDKSTGSCEQPSPISVLEGPFYEDDVASPPTTTKFVLKLEELEEEERTKASAGTSSQRPPPFLKRDGERQSLIFADFDYVKHLVEISCAPQRGIENPCHVWKLRPLDSHYFLQLEEEVASNHGNDELGSSMWRRKMLFDIVNASLERRLHAWRLCQHQPWLLACERGLLGAIATGWSSALRQGIVGVDEENNVCLSNEGGKALLEEVWEEIGANTAKQRGIFGGMATSACEGEEVDGGACDEVGHMLEEDILGRSQQMGCPDAWAALLLEKGELGLDLERLIFKDLIDHTIRDLGLLLHPPLPLTTKRQLFKLHS